MRSLQAVRHDLSMATLQSVLALFALPLAVLWFSSHALAVLDRQFSTSVFSQMIANPAISSAELKDATRFFEATPPSVVCGRQEPELHAYREEVCPAYSRPWQYFWAQRIAWLASLAALGTLALAAFLGGLAFRGRAAMLASLALARRLLPPLCALMIAAQGAMLVWLAIAASHHFWNVRVPKLAGVAAAIAAGAIIHALVHIFRRAHADWRIDGELLREADAPDLWARVRALAAELGTAPPRQVLVGVDANFFVAEAPFTVGGRQVSGRSLYVSLPLLRILSKSEAEAVLVHELAHFHGGDTRDGAYVEARLHQFDDYRCAMYQPGMALIAYYVLTLYSMTFMLALMRDSRAREFQADLVAARMVSPRDLVHGLIKITAYSAYRAGIERELFEYGSAHKDALGIGMHVAKGLVRYACSNDFPYDVAVASLPHPFDTHPGLAERMDNVGYDVQEARFGRVVSSGVDSSWATAVRGSAAIEQRLWKAYEREFASAHEESLAYRYLPRTDEERAIVEAHFPPRIFALRNGDMQVTYDGVLLPADAAFSWSEVEDLGYEDGLLADTLKIVRYGQGLHRPKRESFRLRVPRGRREELQDVLGRYWHRHRAARELAA